MSPLTTVVGQPLRAQPKNTAQAQPFLARDVQLCASEELKGVVSEEGVSSDSSDCCPPALPTSREVLVRIIR